MIPAQVRIDPEHVQESLLGHGQEGVVLTHLDRDGPLGEQLSCSLFKTRWWASYTPLDDQHRVGAQGAVRSRGQVRGQGQQVCEGQAPLSATVYTPVDDRV